MKRSCTLVLGLVCVLAVGPLARGQDLAKMAPPGTPVFIELDDLAGFRADWADDEMVRSLRAQVPDLGPVADIWGYIQSAMGMTGDQLFDTYFGKQLAVVVSEPGDNKPGVIVSKVADADGKLVPPRLGLAPAATVGDFKVYNNGDGTARFAFGKDLMLFAGSQHADWLDKVVAQGGAAASLADDAGFKKWMAKHPAKRSGTLYANDTIKNELHTLGLVRDGKNLSFTYAGQAAGWQAALAKLAKAKANDFGPLPASVLIAATVNLMDPNPADTRAVDGLLTPKTLKRDVLPKVDAPILAFLAEAKADQITPNPGVNLPVLGLAIKMTDPSVAADLDTLGDNLVRLANLATAKWGTAPIEIKIETVEGNSYRVADVGPVLAQRANRPELPLELTRIVYGKVGSWYVLCTQDAFFKQMLAAQSDPKQLLTGSADVTALKLDAPASPLGTLVVRAPALAAHLKGVVAHVTAQRPDLAIAVAGNPQSPEGKLVKGLSIVAGVLEHYQAITVQLAKDGDDSVTGKAQLLRKP